MQRMNIPLITRLKLKNILIVITFFYKNIELVDYILYNIYR